MNKSTRKLPIGIQSFEKLINEGYIYVDKTKFIYELAHSGTQYFLSRPRRFGKSLLLSTMAAYWEGKKELFSGLAIEELEKNNKDAWKSYPVFYFDLNGKKYSGKRDGIGQLEDKLDQILREYEDIYGDKHAERSLEERFEKLLKMAHEQTGQRCVVLVDEYDKPLLEAVENTELRDHNKAVFKGFFSLLKSCDNDIQFVLITGVTKFSKISIFSDLNQLKDISLSRSCAEICGITDSEVIDNFEPEIEELMEHFSMSKEECINKLKSTYYGYHFSIHGEGVYNPYSLLNALWDKEFGSYWFSSGTPTFLVEKLKLMDFDLRQFSDYSLEITGEALSDYRDDNPDPIPLLYQTGYLTIAPDKSTSDYYTLDFPNEEVKYGFLNSLLPAYVPSSTSGSGKSVLQIRRYVEEGNLDRLKDSLIGLYAGITYTSSEPVYEHYFQTVIYLVFELLGKYIHTEVHSLYGRADCIIETKDFVYIFEFKRDSSATEALKQIEEGRYAAPYAADTRKIYKIGVNFDSETKNISEWEVN